MSLLNIIKSKIRRFVQKANTMDAAKAYDLWASSYDDQPGNLLIHLDEQVFAEISKSISYEGKVVADIGCGTGRHWQWILSKKPSQLIGYDVSKEMLEMLRQKFPQGEAHVLNGYVLPGLQDRSCDIIICNLVIGYIEDLEATFTEWNRVLKSNGVIIISDFHPESLQKGGERSFSHDKKKVLIKNYIHPLEKIKALARGMQWKEEAFIEKKVDESIKSFYIEQNALHLYERTYDNALLYGWQFRKQ